MEESISYTGTCGGTGTNNAKLVEVEAIVSVWYQIPHQDTMYSASSS